MGAKLGGAGGARAPPLFLPRPRIIYTIFWGKNYPEIPRPIVYPHFLAPIGAHGPDSVQSWLLSDFFKGVQLK